MFRCIIVKTNIKYGQLNIIDVDDVDFHNISYLIFIFIFYFFYFHIVVFEMVGSFLVDVSCFYNFSVYYK